jgi:hypothetical protein
MIAQLYTEENPDVAAKMAEVAQVVDGYLATE